jgi:hypothetical protein
MNTPDTQKPVMTLEETMGGLSIWRQSFEITGKNSDLTEQSVKSLVDLLRDAYHHLESGKAQEPEWIVNDNAELGVKIGDQFYFLYKGRKLKYTEGHEDGSPLYYRPVGKREFGECCHPINYKDLTRIGTVSLDDSDEWKQITLSNPEQEGQQG